MRILRCLGKVFGKFSSRIKGINSTEESMKHIGNIRKMESEIGDVVQYRLAVGEEMVSMNECIGRPLSLQYLDRINCLKCGRETKKSFAQGYCYPCFISAPETEDCVLHPEKCRAHEGIARDMEYANQHCLIEHVVYLSYTSGIKVGVTRNTQVPTRWIDQGATHAIELARTPNRYTAGLIEVALKAHIDDKTNWRAMLTGDGQFQQSLSDMKHKVLKYIPEELKKYYIEENKQTTIFYPVKAYPERVRSINLDKDGSADGILTGIKGQYLLFEDNSVINIRKYGGYLISLECKL